MFQVRTAFTWESLTACAIVRRLPLRKYAAHRGGTTPGGRRTTFECAALASSEHSHGRIRIGRITPPHSRFGSTRIDASSAEPGTSCVRHGL
jgi:hypothetical protein